jgi:hypothetical protein
VTPVTPGGSALAQALQHLQRADQALRNGDLATYQREVNEAKRILEGANTASPSPSPSR